MIITRKKLIAAMISALLSFSMLSCSHNGQSAGTNPGAPATGPEVSEPVGTELPEDIIEPADYKTETWVAVDLTFETETDYSSGEQLYVPFEAEFKNRYTGTVLRIPGFWNGGRVFKIRFAPTEYGIWDYLTSCPEDPALDGVTGTLAANPYRGELAIYKHGFVTTNGSKHFVYADGTPFFYLGDTHWSMYTEEFDRGGAHAGDTGADSHFKYIVDRRVEQGFTVYQSEPIGTGADLTDGTLSSIDVRVFERNDRYYRYIAEKGLVHANAEFFFAGNMTPRLAANKEYLEAISRYWVARYSAYPVMWTLAQEIDNDFYRERGDQQFYDAADNPWVFIAECLHKYDPYSHPLTGHQENTAFITVTGAGAKVDIADNGGRSAFLSAEVTARTGHNWWAAQWSPSLLDLPDYPLVKDYWNSPKVAVNYESRYANLWTKDFGARAQSWIAMLSGFAGVGYGAADIWLYNSTFDTDTASSDGVDTVTPADKAVFWSQAVEFESAFQQGYMRQFFECFRWWDLIPDFGEQDHFEPSAGKSGAKSPLYVCSTVGSDLYIIYFYSADTSTGLAANMISDAEYEAYWFDPRTGSRTEIGTVKPDTSDTSGRPAWSIPARPDARDWVLVLNRT